MLPKTPEAIQQRIEELTQKREWLLQERRDVDDEIEVLRNSKLLLVMQSHIGKPVWHQSHDSPIGILREIWHDMALVECGEESRTCPLWALFCSHEEWEQREVPF